MKKNKPIIIGNSGVGKTCLGLGDIDEPRISSMKQKLKYAVAIFDDDNKKQRLRIVEATDSFQAVLEAYSEIFKKPFEVEENEDRGVIKLINSMKDEGYYVELYQV